MSYAKLLLENWANREPIASMWLAVATVLLFGVVFTRSHGDDRRFWMWGYRLVESLFQALVFAALLGMFSFLLSSNYASFSQIYSSFTSGGSLSNQNWREWRDRYGGTFIQQDLLVTQYITNETQEIIQPDDPSAPLLYRNIKVEQPISQNSIVGFNGLVTIDVIDPVSQTDTFKGFALSAQYEYQIANPTDVDTRVEFNFPLSADTKLYQNVGVKVNDVEVSSWQIISNTIAWEGYVRPGENKIVSVQYDTWGMDGFLFEVLTPREVRNFELMVALNTDCG